MNMVFDAEGPRPRREACVAKSEAWYPNLEAIAGEDWLS